MAVRRPREDDAQEGNSQRTFFSMRALQPAAGLESEEARVPSHDAAGQVPLKGEGRDLFPAERGSAKLAHCRTKL